MELEDIFLVDYVRHLLGNLPDFDTYNMCDNHSMTRHYFNKVPMMRIDIRSATWDIDEGKDWKEQEFINERMWEEFDDFCNWISEDEGITIFTDMNGYRVLLGCDIYRKIEEAQEKIDEVDELQRLLEESDKNNISQISTEIDDLCSELSFVPDQLKEDIEKVEKFLKLEDRIKSWVKEYPKYWKEWEAEQKAMEEEEAEEELLKSTGQKRLKEVV